MVLTILKMKDHIRELLDEYRITAGTAEECFNRTGKTLQNSGGISIPTERKIFIPEIDSETHYFIALHEIGHVVINDQHEFDDMRQDLRQVVQLALCAKLLPEIEKGIQLLRTLEIQVEFMATAWAQDNALKFTEEMKITAAKALMTHIRSSEQPIIIKVEEVTE